MTSPGDAQIIEIGSDQLSAKVSADGAEMQSLTTACGNSLLWCGDSAFWGGRSPVLFPIVGRAPEDMIAVDGQMAKMAQHGFARRRRFELVGSGPDFCRHLLVADEATREAYPFEFRLLITHRIKGASLAVSAEVTNADSRVMPFGIGFHPAFCWPLPGQQDLAAFVTLENGAEPALARLQGGLLCETRMPSPFRSGLLEVLPGLFADDAMIFPQGAGSGLRYGPEKGPGLRFRFHNLPNLALWSKPGAPFLCIEPWHGMAATVGKGHEIADRPFSLALPPGQSAHFGFEVAPDPGL